MSDADARVFIESIRSTVSKNPELYKTGEQISKLLVSSMTDYAKKTGQLNKFLDVNKLFDTSFFGKIRLVAEGH